MRLLDHVGGFLLRLRRNVGLHVFAGLLRIGNDAGSFSLSLGELLLVLFEQTFAFLAGLFGVFEVISTVLARPILWSKTGQPNFARMTHKMMKATSMGMNSFILGRMASTPPPSEANAYAGPKSDGSRRGNNSADFADLSCVRFQLACLLFFLRKNHAVNRMD